MVDARILVLGGNSSQRRHKGSSKNCSLHHGMIQRRSKQASGCLLIAVRRILVFQIQPNTYTGIAFVFSQELQPKVECSIASLCYELEPSLAAIELKFNRVRLDTTYLLSGASGASPRRKRSDGNGGCLKCQIGFEKLWVAIRTR